MILVPVKNLARCQAAALSRFESGGTSRAGASDVRGRAASIGALARAGLPVAVVTSDPFARDLAARFNFEVIADDNSGETNAIEMATAVCRERGARSTLVIPADIPLIDSSELQRSSTALLTGGAVLVPDAAGRGTNAAWRSPGDLFPLRFGNDSFLPHLAAAKATGLPCVVLELAGDCAGCRSSGRSARTGGCQRRPSIAEAGAELELSGNGIMRGSTSKDGVRKHRRTQQLGKFAFFPIAVGGEIRAGDSLSAQLAGGSAKRWACAFRMATSWW